jgi:cyclic lactone autoinducer peptide
MKEQIASMGEKLVDEIGNAAVKLGEQSRGRCTFIFAYEPEIPMELLQEDTDK